MRTLKWLVVAVLAVSMVEMDVEAQSASFSIGPQASVFGIGGAASVQMGDLLSFSAEYSFVPNFSANLKANDVKYSMEPAISAGIIGIHLHPFENKFSIGVGVVFGEFGIEGNAEYSDTTVEIGDEDFPVADVGNLNARFAIEGPWPAIMMGWRGNGLNFGLGVFIAGDHQIELTASGDLRNDPHFQAAIDRETDDISSEFDSTVIPLIRFGWQIGF